MPASNEGEVMAVVDDGAGGVFAVIQAYNDAGPNSRPLIVVRYDGQGNTLWETRVLGGAPAGKSVGTVAQCAIDDGQGGVLIGGFESRPGLHPPRATLFRVDSNGTELPPTAPFGNVVSEIYDVDRSASGDYLLVGGTPAGNWAGRTDSSLASLWVMNYDAMPGLEPDVNGFMRLVEEDELGNVFVATSTGVGTDFTGTSAARLNPMTGEVLWVTAPETADRAQLGGLAGRPGGGVDAAGSFFSNDPATGINTRAFFIRSVLPDGSVLPQVDRFDGATTITSVRGLRRGSAGLYLFGRRLESFVPGQGSLLLPRVGFVDLFEENDEVGAPYCTPALANSTGVNGSIQAFGSTFAADDDVVLLARDLPARQFAMFVSGSASGVTPLMGGSGGALCIAGNLGRFSGSLADSGLSGVLRYGIDTASIPTATGPIAASVGLTWYFQCWHRDDPAVSPSNTTNAVAVTFD